MEDKKITIKVFNFPYILFQLPTAMIGYTIHNSFGWAIMDFIFAPLAWCKWLIMQEVNMSIIKETFNFFLK
jgi:hypothetical protein